MLSTGELQKLYVEVPKVDAHAHVHHPAIQCDDPFLTHVQQTNFRLVTLNANCCAFSDVAEQRNIAVALRRNGWGQLVDFAASFPSRHLTSCGFLDLALDAIQSSMLEGAVAVKLWKDLTWGLRDRKGGWVMIDHFIFDGLFEFLQSESLPVVIHNGEPGDRWKPVDEMVMRTNVNYYSKFPKYHITGSPEVPPRDDYVAAIERVMDRFPKLKICCAHLASLEDDYERLGEFLNGHDNAFVDTARRDCYFWRFSAVPAQRHRLIQFLEHWALKGRIFFGTDLVYDGSQSAENVKKEFDRRCELAWLFYATNETLQASEYFAGEFTGLGLNPDVVRRIFSSNAKAFYGLSS